MWLSAIKLAVSAGSKIYANKQKAKMAMSDAQLLHAERQARGEEAYQGKLLEARQSDWKDEAVLIILSLPVLVLAWAVISDDPTAMDKVKLFFDMFSQLPSWFTNLWILVVASIYGIKGTQIFRNGGKKIMAGLVGAALRGFGKALGKIKSKKNLSLTEKLGMQDKGLINKKTGRLHPAHEDVLKLKSKDVKNDKDRKKS